MKILALELADKNIYGYMDHKDKYIEFSTYQNNEISIDFEFKKSDYKDLEHFRGVIGKFNPYIFFLDPIEKVEKLNFKELKQIINKRYKIKNH